MTDSVAVLPAGWRALDDNGDPISGAKLKFYAAGTSTPKTVYADEDLSTSLGTVVTCDAGGYPTSDGSARTLVYTGTALYKLVITTSADVTVSSHDSIKGAVAIPATDELALPQTPVISKTAAYSIVVGDQGKVINANPTGGAFALTLPSAVTAEDGFRITIRHTGTSNAATIRTTGSETITFAGQTKGSVALTALGESMQLVSDGANWHVDAYAPPVMRGTLGIISITDRLTAPPTSPTGSARYIINGTPTGAWSTLSFSEGQVVEADGNGSWFAYTPADGWLAYVTDENLFTAYVDSAWEDQTGMGAPSESVLSGMTVTDTKAQNTSGGTAATGAWTTHTLNTENFNTITGASLASDTITLPAGTYSVRASAQFSQTNLSRIRFRATDGSVSLLSANGNFTSANAGTGEKTIAGTFTIAASKDFKLEYYCSAAGTLGTAHNVSGETEVYARVDIIDLTALQGPAGEQGAQGADGLDAAYPYQWSTSTSGDPGSGKIAGNNATIASITQIAISETDSAGGSMAAVIALWDDSTSTAKARLKISKEGATQNFHAFTITGSGTDQGSYWTFPVSYVSTSGTISNADDCAVLVLEKGDKGDTGATGSAGSTGATGATGATGPNTGLDYAWATATSGDPGSGKVLANNATLSSATAVHISKTGRNGESLGAVLATWDDSTDTHKGHLRIFTVADRTEYLEAEVSGITDNSTYYTVAISATAGNGTPSANDVMAVMFERTGNKGTDGAGSGDVVGPASATDNAAARYDLTTGKLLQDSALLIGDNADLTAYDATNDGNPVFAYGASATERLRVVPTYDSGAQTLDYVLFTTDVASASADKGLFRFSPDGAAVLDIDDDGLNFAASKGISIAGTDILTDSAGTATLSNIDALDATTEATIEAAIDTLANLSSIPRSSDPATAINVYQESGETTRFASTVIRGSDTGASHSGNERTLYAVEHRPVGSGTNGPTHADYGHTISVIKQDFDGSPAVGEIDGQLVVVRQGGTGSDAAAHLVNIAHYGTGFAAVLEGVSSLISASTDYSVRVQIGVVDNVTNLHYGYSTVADVGANDYAYYAANETGASWAYLFYGLTDNVNVFHVTNNGVIKSYRDNSAGTASLVLEQDGTGDIIQQFVLTGTRAWEIGIDNSDSDKFKWSPVADAFASAVASLTTAGAFAVNSSVAVGVAGTTTGTLSASGSTSGTATITAQAAAGTPTLTLPNSSGTFAVSGTAPIAVNATTGAITITSADAWSAYTPGAVTSSSGTITTASATGRYIQHGKTVYFKLTITVTTNGTGSGVLQVADGLPVAPRGGAFDKFHGGNLSNSTSQWAYNQSAGSQSLYVINYTAAYPVSGDGQTIIVDGTYEAA